MTSVMALPCVVVSGQHLVSAARQRAIDKQEVTPSRVHALVPTHLQDDLERDPTHLMLKQMCIRVMGRGVVSFQQLRDQMLLEMTSGDGSGACRYSKSASDLFMLKFIERGVSKSPPCL